MNGVTSLMKAGEIYEKVFQMRRAIDELSEALSAIYDELGEQHIAYKLLDDQKTAKFNELRQFENQLFVPHSGTLPR